MRNHFHLLHKHLLKSPTRWLFVYYSIWSYTIHIFTSIRKTTPITFMFTYVNVTFHRKTFLTASRAWRVTVRNRPQAVLRALQVVCTTQPPAQEKMTPFKRLELSVRKEIPLVCTAWAFLSKDFTHLQGWGTGMVYAWLKKETTR